MKKNADFLKQGFHHDADSPNTGKDAAGSVRITKHVIGSIIELAAIQVEGVARIAPITSPWAKILWRSQPQRGIAIDIRDNTIYTDVYLVVKHGFQMTEVGLNAQNAIAKALRDMIGMQIGEINIFIQDIS